MHSSIIRKVLPSAFLLVSLTSSAQSELVFDGSIPVSQGGTPFALAWAGGINYTQVGQLDLDQDGLKDLVLFDRTGNAITTLLNTGGSGTNAYVLTRAFDAIAPFSTLHDWALFRDYNCDGKEDIFTYSQAGFSVYRNTSTTDGLSFELLKFRVNCEYVFTDGTSQVTNLYVSSDDLPGIADVDGDGDLDVLTFSQLGSYVQYYKNMSLENHGTCDSLDFVLRNACWGRFSENASTNDVMLNAPCPFQVPNPEFGEGDAPVAAEPLGDDRALAHAGSSVTPLDLNGDGVMDLLLGDISFPNLVALTNGGSVDDSFMISVDNAFPNYDQTLYLPIFPAAFHLDVDNDGVRDLLVSPNSRSLAQNYESVWYYHNNGTDAAPDFEFQQTDLFQSRMMDLGEGAYPVPFDHNGDGLMDLIVANDGYFEPTGDYKGKLALLENVGTLTSPAFEILTEDYMNLSTSGIGVSMYPAFGDLDGDGDLDMYIGDLQGKFHFYRNTPSAGVAQFTLIQPNIMDAGGTVIDVGRHATPLFTDLDGDGLIDLISGEQNGNLNFYRNTGTELSPSWTYVTDSLGRVRTNDVFTLGHSVPYLYTSDNGVRELMVGSESGRLWHYDGIEGNLGGTWNLISSGFMDIDEGFRSGVCLHDFTGDGELDMVVGNYRGGLSFWRSDAISGLADLGRFQSSVSAWPNPTTGSVELVVPELLQTGTVWVVRNSLGQDLFRVPHTGLRTVLDLSGSPNGIYTIRAEGGSMTRSVRVVLSR